ncbi:carbohydrate ABC transporter permease [Bradyrhizobium sp. CCGUVB23]|uniref:carbohydrate ABC transporter permease n=1 Tax=Bradyrhizobium sp. CCGUVB23 TaxID=2949630 RepID=UPI0020B1E7E0|nr:carbohydrate ABC transporter permease [Bradyrhizobium sp. CCGUVB23]MCP3464541.1 carbohydrate ABC transporter permease [Bradyrhizobium sp. CCGUVB23]
MKGRTNLAGLGFGLFRHLVLGAGAILMLAPFILMVSISLKTQGEIYAPHFHLLPDGWKGLSNYAAAFTRQPLGRYLLNGLFVGVCIFVAQVALALPCAYALAKLRWHGRETTFVLVLAGLLVPPQVTAIPIYVMLWKFGILDSYLALILPPSISVFGIFLMRQFFRTVPDDLLDAARLDGLSEFAIVWRIMVPTAIPALVSFGILSLVWHWNDFFWPLIVVQSEQLAPPPLGILFFANAEAGTNYGYLMAAAVVVNAPLAVAFLFAQRWFIDSMTMSAVK